MHFFKSGKLNLKNVCRQAAVLSVLAAFVSFVVVLAQLLIDKDTFPEPKYENPTFISFSLGFGTLLFSYGGAAIFPTIQNDTKHRHQFWKSVVMAFAGNYKISNLNLTLKFKTL